MLQPIRYFFTRSSFRLKSIPAAPGWRESTLKRRTRSGIRLGHNPVAASKSVILHTSSGAMVTLDNTHDVNTQLTSYDTPMLHTNEINKHVPPRWDAKRIVHCIHSQSCPFR